jgi:hypothetical protein
MKSPIVLEDLTKAVHPRVALDYVLEHREEFINAVETAIRVFIPRETEIYSYAYKKTEEEKDNGSCLAYGLLEEHPLFLQWEDKDGDYGALYTEHSAWEIFTKGNDKRPCIGGIRWDFKLHECMPAVKEFPPEKLDEKIMREAIRRFYVIMDVLANKKAVLWPGPETYRFKGGKKVFYPPFLIMRLDLDGKLAEQLAADCKTLTAEPEMPSAPYWFDGDFAVTLCSVTKQEGRVHFPTNLRADQIPPKDVAKAFHAAGWDFDPYNADRIRSPAHARITHLPRPKLTLVENKPMPTPAAPPSSPRQLTTKERAAVRDLLDTHFDDEAGRYRNGYTDQNIGDELNIPYALVSGMREAAYGPIKSDPEIDQLEDSMAVLDKRIKEGEDTLNTALVQIEEMKAIAENLRGRLNTMANRRKRILA